MMDVQPGEDRACPVCGESEKAVLFEQRFQGIEGGSLLAGYDVVACRACGFCFANNLPDQAGFDDYYREMSKYEYQERGGQLSEYDRRRFPETARVIAGFLPDKTSRILDVGCSNGGLLQSLKEQGYVRLLGIDPSPVCAETARDLYGIRVLTGDLKTLPEGIGPFDLVILGSVLEHIRDLRPALGALRALLAPGGLLYIEVPDATTFADVPDAPFQEFSIEHINFFSPVSLTNLLGANGFSAVQILQTSFDQNPDKVVHELRAAFRKEESPLPSEPARDKQTERDLVAYIDRSREVERGIHRSIDGLVESGRPFVVWGVGTHTQRLMVTSRLAQGRIAAFIDSNARYHGKLLNGVPIIGPAALKERSEPILVSSRVFQREIETQIREDLALENEVVLLYEV
jgi:SAM-dependent methyltransferase